MMDFFGFAMQCSCAGIALASRFLKSEGPIDIQTTVSLLFFPTNTTTLPLLHRHKRQDQTLNIDSNSFTSDIYEKNNENILFTTPLNDISSINQSLQTILAGFHIEWELPVALIFVSLTW